MFSPLSLNEMPEMYDLKEMKYEETRQVVNTP